MCDDDEEDHKGKCKIMCLSGLYVCRRGINVSPQHSLSPSNQLAWHTRHVPN